MGELVGRLDRLPLAIQLVASRGRMLSPTAMLARLDDVLELRSRADRPSGSAASSVLSTGAGACSRPTVRAAMSRLGVFSGPFGIDEAGS